MSATYSWYISSTEVDEPSALTTSQTYTVTNTGDEKGVSIGFYIKQASTMGSIEYPSVDSPSVNLTDILSQGNAGYGLSIEQDSDITIFTSTTGSDSSNKIPFTLGSGSNFDELEVGASATITLNLSFSPGTDSKTFYVDLVME